LGSTEVYSLHGMSIRSDLVLGVPEPAWSSVDLTVLTSSSAASLPSSSSQDSGGDSVPAGQVIAELVAEDRRFYTGVDQGEHYVLRIHGICDFVVKRTLDAVECRPVADADPEVLSLLVRGGLLAFVLGLGGTCVLHASVVEADQGSVAFVGASGMGKSTMAALACRDGARFVSDDLLRLDGEASPGWVGCSSELRLRPGAAPMAAGQEWSGRDTVDERLALRPPGPKEATGKLAAIVIPAPSRTEPELLVTRVDPVEAIFVLTSFPRMAWTAPSIVAGQFEGITRLADAVPVYFARVPWGPPFAEHLGRDLLAEVLGTSGPAA
jgi:hypothetical protein